MAQVTFKLPIDMPQVNAVPSPSSSPASHFSWDMLLTGVLIMIICFCACTWMTFLMNMATNQLQCTPDGSQSTGTNGSDCCSSNGIDSNGNCVPSGPMGYPPYGMQGGSFSGVSPSAPLPAPIPSPPNPYVSMRSSPAPNST